MEKSKPLMFLLFALGLIIIIGGIGFLTNKPAAPSKLDGFAKALTDSGSKMYGAFWCPHCQAQKAEFGTSKEYLPYVECSNPDKSQTQICIDNKIESYPTWKFKDGFTIESKVEPSVCSIAPGKDGEIDACKNRNSPTYKTWLFDGYAFAIQSPTDPVKKGDTWVFAPTAQTVGELPLEFLAKTINYTLPQ